MLTARYQQAKKQRAQQKGLQNETVPVKNPRAERRPLLKNKQPIIDSRQYCIDNSADCRRNQEPHTPTQVTPSTNELGQPTRKEGPNRGWLNHATPKQPRKKLKMGVTHEQ